MTEALNITELAIPRATNAYRRRIVQLGEPRSGMLPARIHSVATIMVALLRDDDAGLLEDFGNRIRAETFDTFLEHADAHMTADNLKIAGVLAGVVFEDTMRRIFHDKGHQRADEKLDEIINTLARDGVITHQQSKQARVAAGVRTEATHAGWDEFNSDDVAATIRFTRALLRDHLGG